MDFHVLETEVEMMMDLIGNRRRIWVTISTGRESQLTLALSDIAACFQRERQRLDDAVLGRRRLWTVEWGVSLEEIIWVWWNLDLHADSAVRLL